MPGVMHPAGAEEPCRAAQSPERGPRHDAALDPSSAPRPRAPDRSWVPGPSRTDQPLPAASSALNRRCCPGRIAAGVPAVSMPSSRPLPTPTAQGPVGRTATNRSSGGGSRFERSEARAHGGYPTRTARWRSTWRGPRSRSREPPDRRGPRLVLQPPRRWPPDDAHLPRLVSRTPGTAPGAIMTTVPRIRAGAAGAAGGRQPRRQPETPSKESLPSQRLLLRLVAAGHLRGGRARATRRSEDTPDDTLPPTASSSSAGARPTAAATCPTTATGEEEEEGDTPPRRR